MVTISVAMLKQTVVITMQPLIAAVLSLLILPSLFIGSGEAQDTNTPCNGANGCCEDYLNITDETWNYVLLPPALCDIIEKLERTQAVLSWIKENFPGKGILNDPASSQFGELAGVNKAFLDSCLDEFVDASATFLEDLKN